MGRHDVTWVQTVSGMAVDLPEPKPEQILLGDIAHALARIARFNGHTIGDLSWNVAQHSLLVEQLLPEDACPATRLVALLHDAHEAYIGDIVSPLFMAVNSMFHAEVIPVDMYPGSTPSWYLKEIARRLDSAIHKAFGIEPTQRMRDLTRTADLLALRVEADLLMVPRRREWTFLPSAPDLMPVLVPVPPTVAQAMFLERFDRVQRMRHGLT